MKKTLLIFLNTLSSISVCGQYELDRKRECVIKIDKDFSHLVLAYGDDGCSIFNPNLIREFYTLLVFSQEDNAKMLYQVSYFRGLKEGVELFYIEEERVIKFYHKGKEFGESYTYYNSGELHYVRKYKNGNLKNKVLEYSRTGKLLNEIHLYKNGHVKKVISRN